jgi:hypothetical protein
MTGAITTTYDISLLTRQISNLKGFLLGTGATPGQCQDVLRVQAGLLAWEISKQVGPATLPQGRAKVEKDMRGVFFPLKTNVAAAFADRQGNQADFLWLFAYKKGDASFLVGANTADVLGDGGDMRKAFYEQANRTRGAAWNDLGEFSHTSPDSKGNQRPHFKRWRGRQHALKLNRIVVTPGAYAAFKKQVMDKLGQLRASFAATAVALRLKKRVPGWVEDQISAVNANGKSIFNGAAMNHPTNPVIEFGSRAKGVVSNPIVADAIRGAVKTRTAKLAKTMLNVIQGATYKFNTGQTYWTKPKISEEE